ncbi:MAG: SRPBCC domain-containing protein [Thermomicrobiales bacterium]|nr:SRPBCC domain-containing protein [Thermomicrobiales bacterium]MCO5218841.1 SRPBCC domain-containing protein [Thermomicrobiales bacterium]MCO5225720.1 SRPBCC domain-containing protein [Thermomicrobiales bacterium]MCO5227929.1 SRPBCC domain-containing protein [Thermomicrobiales bacterium]
MEAIENWSHGTLTATRTLPVDQRTAFDAWVQLEHRRRWFAGPGWTEIERAQDLRVGGSELAHGIFPDGTETIYRARYHRIDDGLRLIYDFDMTVAGRPFSVSLASVEFVPDPEGTMITYIEQGIFFAPDYDAVSRSRGTEGLLDQFAAYVNTLA